MKNLFKYFLSISAIGFFIFLGYGSQDDGENSTIELNASISISGSQFVITNNDNFDYINAKLQINEDYFLKVYNLKAGEVFYIDMMEFADEKGNRFSIFQKPLNFSIWCELSNEKKGFYYAEWN